MAKDRMKYDMQNQSGRGWNAKADWKRMTIKNREEDEVEPLDVVFLSSILYRS